jgi:hypothetical protein
MIRTAIIRVVRPIVVLIIALAIALPARATGSLTRTFVSSTGVDTNPCTTAQPCATFAAAYAAVAANGIVAALDPGKYGPLTNINTGVTINGNGWSAITAPANGNGITINAGTANVTLIGLEIDGAGAAYNGILLNSAGSLTVTDCTLQNFSYSNNNIFTGNGILMEPTSGTLDFTITKTTASNNGYAGVFYAPPTGSPSANGVLDQVIADANQFGISVSTSSAGGGATVLIISNSIASGNTVYGIYLDNGSGSPTVKVSIDNVSISGNTIGVVAENHANVLLGRSIIAGNSVVGIHNVTSPNTFYTYGDNSIDLNDNGADIDGPLSTSFAQQ